MENNSIVKWISILSRQLTHEVSADLNRLDLKSSEYIYIFTLEQYPQITQEELSTICFIDKAATARSIRNLEEKKFVMRLPDPNDGRANLVSLTNEGKTLVQKLHVVMDTMGERIADSIGKAELDELNKNLEHLSKTLLTKGE